MATIRRSNRPMGRAPLPTVARAIIALELILGLGALFGGGALVLAPDGHLLSMPTSLLAGSPFRDYLVPGAVLFTVVGVGSVIAAVLAYLRVPVAPLAATAAGTALMGWIVVEMVVLAGWGSLAWSFYLLLGAAITGAGLWWLRTR